MIVNSHILVIKHGALGDFILASSAFRAIRRFHAGAHIVLITSSPYKGLAKQTHYFDEIWIDDRPKWWQLSKFLKLIKLLRGGSSHYRFQRIYDLQASTRTRCYFKCLKNPKPEWVGIAKGCSHPHLNPQRTSMGTIARLQDQLKVAGISKIEPDGLQWLTDEIESFCLPDSYVLLIPGSSSGNIHKRWSAEGYAELVDFLAEKKVHTLVVGTETDRPFVEKIVKGVKSDKLISLLSKCTLGQLAELARHALLTIGSDTGPMHIAIGVNSPSIMLCAMQSKPVEDKVCVIRVGDLSSLPTKTVVAKLQNFLKSN